MEWNSVDDLLKAMEGTEYVFLRNWDALEEACDQGEDWDVLCLDKNAMVNITRAIPLNEKTDCFNFYTVINGKKLLVDIRCIGDGYYAACWEKEMIKNRIRIGHFYALCNEDYKYSILYHAILQKKEREAVKYDQLLSGLFYESDKEKWIRMLADFMGKKGYRLPLPLDDGVYINRRNYNKLEEMMNGGKN